VTPQHRDEPPESRRYVRLWVVVLVLLTGLTLAVQRDDGRSDDDLADLGLEPSPTAPPRPGRGSSGLQQPGEDASALASRVPEVEVPVTCWSGDEAADLADCPPFTGEVALRHVFPGLETAEGCLSLPVSAPKLVSVRCPVEVDGTEAEVTYSEFVGHRALLDYYAQKYDAPTGRSGDLVLYGPAPVNGRGAVQGTATYAEGGRWSVSFRGEDEELTRRTLDTIEVRRWDALVATVDPADLDQTDSNVP
jgi:hypothetical protein